jgi:hypothetical protein
MNSVEFIVSRAIRKHPEVKLYTYTDGNSIQKPCNCVKIIRRDPTKAKHCSTAVHPHSIVILYVD